MLRRARQWLVRDDAVAAIEAGFIFPIMISILIGTIDTGKALLLNQKVINSAAMMSDLIGRQEDLTDAELEDIVAAGRLAMDPYDAALMGYDIVGIQFTGGGANPSVIWRETENMAENAAAVAGAAGLGGENEGVVAVTVEYTYMPFFSGYFIGEIGMQETFYARSRSANFVTRS